MPANFKRYDFVQIIWNVHLQPTVTDILLVYYLTIQTSYINKTLHEYIINIKTYTRTYILCSFCDMNIDRIIFHDIVKTTPIVTPTYRVPREDYRNRLYKTIISHNQVSIRRSCATPAKSNIREPNGETANAH